MTRYNGWANYETWAVNLHLTNEQGSDSYWREAAAETWENAEAQEHWTRSETARYAMADRLKDEIEECNPLSCQPSMYNDLLTAALSDVDWQEIADGFLEDCEGYETTPAKEDSQAAG